MIFLLLWPLLWLLKSLAVYFSLVLALTVAYRIYKIIWAGRNKRPVSSRDAVLITGATSGLGLALAKYLYKIGYTVIVGYYDPKEAGYNQLKQLSNDTKSKKSDQKILFLELDVRKQESISKAYAECTQLFEQHNLKLCALINNAGVGSLQPFAWLQRRIIRNIVETNLLGCLMMTREFMPLLVKAHGRVLNVSSGLGLIPGPTYTTYGITKMAQVYFTRCLNFELKSRFGVQSVAVIPHNYIKNTNICSLNVKNNENAWEELTAQERQIYEKEFREHCRLAKSLEEATKEHSIMTNEHKFNKSITPANNQQSNKTHNNNSNWLWILLNGLKEVANRLQGKNAAITLEESGTLECFEAALRLEDPPEHIFAGDNIYNLIIGSLILSLPSSCMNLLSTSVAPSLYK